MLVIQFNPQDTAGTYQVTVSGGPTPVNPFDAPHAANGSETYDIPHNGTDSSLQAGTYTVKIRMGKFGGTFTETVMGG
jgi:hypothetical protein